MQEIWSEEGPLAKVIDGYELRPQQVELAAIVQETLEGGGLLLAEAPPGVGKSLAYTIPAVLWALDEGARVVVSTNTKNLQDQLYTKDLPVAAAVAGRKLRAALLKGRSNYVCIRKWDVLQKGQIELPIEGTRVDVFEGFGRWLRETRTGDLSELDVGRDAPLTGLVELVRVEEGACDMGRCSIGEECFLRKLKRRAWESQVICTNHALLLGDLLGRWDILPPFDVMIADECHNLPRVAADQLGLRLSGPGMAKALARLMRVAGPLTVRRKGSRKAAGQLAATVRDVGGRADALFRGLNEFLRSQREATALRYRSDGELGGRILEWGAPLKAGCVQLLESLRGVIANASGAEPDTIEELEAEFAVWTQTARDLECLVVPAEGEGVYWVDSTPALRWSPIDVSDRLGPALDGACRTTVLTSATVTVRGDFSYITTLMGLTREHSSYPRCVALDSPFDLRASVLFLVTREAPDPRGSDFPEFVAQAVRGFVYETGKKALVLFTSHSMLRAARRALEDPSLPAQVLAQGVDGERAEITRRFKSAKQAVLLGTASFWEGVDFPGEEAEVLVIAKLPFPVPTEPLVEARSEALYSNGMDPFTSYHLPEAVIRLRQGFGRLIRNQYDRGVVAVLDRRVARAAYGRAFLDSLPVEPSIVSNLDEAAAAAAAWFQGG